jgi:hypothetical protein
MGGGPPDSILHARYFTCVNVQQKLCRREGYERVTCGRDREVG